MKLFRKAALPAEGLTVSGICHVQIGLESRGLSGEHIELCAEGARQKPNLSGKRTEKCIAEYYGISMQAVLIMGCLLHFLQKERKLRYVRKTH